MMNQLVLKTSVKNMLIFIGILAGISALVLILK